MGKGEEAMKRPFLWVTLLSALTVMLAALGVLCGAIYGQATDAALYGEKSRQAVADALGTREEADITAYIGLDAAQQAEAASAIALYMAHGGEGERLGLPILGEREIAHMADVRGLIALCGNVRAVCISLAGALAVAIAWIGAGIGRHRAALLGALAGLLALAALAFATFLMLNTAGFADLFVRMHEVVFTNDLWLLNPKTDILIRMMPQGLFERALADVAVQAAGALAVALSLLCAVYVVVSGMIRRHLAQEVSAT